MKDTHASIDALTADFQRHGAWLRRLAHGLVLDRSEADDLLQEAWLAATQSGQRPAEPGRAWFAGVLRNVARTGRRGAGRLRTREALAVEEALQRAALATTSEARLEREQHLLGLLQDLPAAQRGALVARYFDDLSPAAIARRDGVPVETVKSRLKRGLEALRTRLEGELGDRHSLALWLAPLARGRAERLASGGTLLAVGGLAAASLVAGAFVALGGLDRGVTPPTDSDLALAPVEVEGAPPAVEPAAAVVGAPRVAPPASERDAQRSDLRVLVVDGVGGPPVPGADVAVLEFAVLQELAEARLPYLEDMERLFIERGRWLTTDASGSCLVQGTAPFVLRAATDLLVGYAPVEEAAQSATLTLGPAPRVRVRVQDAAGRPADGVPVSATLTLRTPQDNEARGGAETYGFERRSVEGLVSFQDPAGFFAPGTLPADTTPVWTRFEVDLPGAVETEPAAGRGASIRAPGKLAARKVLELTVPELGSLEVEVVDGTAPRDALDGTARLRVLDGPFARNRAYEAAIVDGLARWPQVAVGIHAEVEVSLPGFGATWTSTGRGPTRPGEAARWTTARVERPALTGRLVDADGQPFGNTSGSSYHGTEAHAALKRGTAFTTDSEGRFRIEWHDLAAVHAPVLLEFRHGVRLAAVELVGAGEDLGIARELGDVVVTSFDQQLRGRCVDSDGKPLAGIHVSATLIHGNWVARETDADGRFELSLLAGPEVTIQCTDDEERFVRRTFVFDQADLDQPLDLVLGRGAKAVVTLADRDLLQGLSGAYMQLRSRGAGDIVGFNGDLGVGPIESEPVPAGEYSAELWLGGSAPFFVLESVTLVDGQTLDLPVPALGALLRSVQLEGADGAAVQTEIQRADGHSVLLTRGDGNALVPRSGEGRARFFRVGRRSLVVPFSELGERHTVELRPPLPVTLVVQGTLDARTRLQFEGEHGSEASGELVLVTRDAFVDGRAEVPFPAPGRYRLVRLVEHRTPGSQVVSASFERTTAVFTIEDGQGPTDLEINLAAPLKR